MKRLALLLVLACTGKSPTPPPPSYDPSTLLVENQSGEQVDLLARCCGNQQFTAPVPAGTSLCLIMREIIGPVTIEALGPTYAQRDSLPSPHSNPAWTWTLTPVGAQLRTATTPCG